MADEADVEATGWDAITRALEQLHGPGEPAGHWGTVVPWSEGGDDPLQGVSAYASERERPHWHYVSLGLTELFVKESEDAEVSGWGFELSFRLAREAGEAQPPLWPVSLLQKLARYVFETGHGFAAGHHMDATGPICLDSPTKLCALAFASVPDLPPVASPNGRFEFVHVFGITLDELEAIEVWDTRSFLELLPCRAESLVSDLARESYLNDEAFAQRVRQATASEGASCGVLYHPQFGFSKSWGRLHITLGAKEVRLFRKLLPGRLLHDRPLLLAGPESSVRFERREKRAERVEKDELVVELTTAGVLAVSETLKPLAGDYRAAGLNWRVDESPLVSDEGDGE